MEKTIDDAVKTIKNACQRVIDAPLPAGTKLSVEVVKDYGNNEVRLASTMHGSPASLTKLLLAVMSQDKDFELLMHSVQMCEAHLDVTALVDQDDLEPEEEETEEHEQ